MPAIVISDLDGKTQEWLERRAAVHGWSLQEEVRRILTKVAQSWDDLEQFLKDHPPPAPAPLPPKIDKDRLAEIRERWGLHGKEQ